MLTIRGRLAAEKAKAEQNQTALDEADPFIIGFDVDKLVFITHVSKEAFLKDTGDLIWITNWNKETRTWQDREYRIQIAEYAVRE